MRRRWLWVAAALVLLCVGLGVRWDGINVNLEYVVKAPDSTRPLPAGKLKDLRVQGTGPDAVSVGEISGIEDKTVASFLQGALNNWAKHRVVSLLTTRCTVGMVEQQRWQASLPTRYD
jgi:hypothetical protein